MVIPLVEVSFLVLGSVLMIPALSTAPIRVLTRWYPQRHVTAAHLVLRTHWFITGLFVLSLLLGKPVAYGFLGFAAFWAIKEHFTTMPTRRSDRRILFLIYMLIPLQLFFMTNGNEQLTILFLPIFALVFLPLLLWSVNKNNFYDALMLLQWGILTTVWGMSMAVTIWLDPLKAHPLVAGGGLLLYLVVMAQINSVIRKNVLFRTPTA